MNKLKYWLPAIILMVIIFLASNDPVSGEKLDFITRFIWNTISLLTGKPSTPEQEAATTFVIRKLAHVTEYLLLCLSYYYALRKTFKLENWQKTYFVAFIAAFFYAVSDEFHQTFIAGRVGTYEDVLIDTVGVCLGYLVIYVYSGSDKYNN